MTNIEQLSTDELAIHLAELKMHEQEPYLTEERKEQIRREIGYASFELQERNKENA